MYLLEARRVISEPINFRTVSLMNWLSTTLQIFSLQLKLCSVAIDHRFAPLTRNTLWRNTAGVINKWWLSIVFLGIRSWSIRTKEFHKYWNGGQQPRANSLIESFKLERFLWLFSKKSHLDNISHDCRAIWKHWIAKLENHVKEYIVQLLQSPLTYRSSPKHL